MYDCDVFWYLGQLLSVCSRKETMSYCFYCEMMEDAIVLLFSVTYVYILFTFQDQNTEF